jgi:hypothetical protein
VSLSQQSTERKKRQAATFDRGSRRNVAFADKDLWGFGTTKRIAEEIWLYRLTKSRKI